MNQHSTMVTVHIQQKSALPLLVAYVYRLQSSQRPIKALLLWI